ncbi:MAG: AAA family ATPase [Patescibacteria group bacterium]|jgi:ATP-dependent Clp protease ATP-binding subunit ClpC
MEEPKKNEPIFSVCAECGGSGQVNFLPCFHCKGVGVGLASGPSILFWGKRLGITSIRLSRIERKINLAVNIIAYLAGLAGIISLGFWAYLNYREGNVDVADYFIWQKKNALILWFWISVVFDMFLIYRTSEKERKLKAVRILKDDEKKPKNIFGKKKDARLSKVNIAESFGLPAIKAVEDAYFLAASYGHETVGVRHLFLSLLKDEKILGLFFRLNANVPAIKGKIESQLSLVQKGGGLAHLNIQEDNDFKKAMILAYAGARDLGQPAVEPINFILPIVGSDRLIEDLLYEMEIDGQKIQNVVNWFRINDEMAEKYSKYRSQSRFKPSTNMNRAYTAVATPLLDNFGYDLTVAAKWGKLEFCVAREKEISQAFSIVDSGQAGILLVGPPGTGKKAIIQGIAQLMAEEEVPKIFRDKRLIEIDTSRLISGATAAQAEERLQELIDEANRSGNIILAMHDIQTITGISAGGEESLELSEVLANAIDRKYVICIATVTSENYTKYLEGRALGSAMGKVEVNEPAGDQAVRILSSKINFLEGRYGVFFSYSALEQVIALTVKYIHDSFLPAKAVKVMETVSARAAKKEKEKRFITKSDIAEVVSEITHIPVAQAAGEESEKLLNLEEEIHKYMINQKEAVNVVSASLRRARAQMTEGKRPIASFLFLGPTGVGKTELAKSIARVYFGDEKCMIRLDMSEYQIPESVNNLIGGEGSPGHLTEAVRKAPFSLILLDEFEKAYKDILNLFLQVMDDGRLTDGQGRTVDFTNSIIIATSNAGALYIQEALKDKKNADFGQIKETLINEHLNKILRPELINRFDGIIVFEPLDQENVIDITRLMVKTLSKTLLAKGIGLEAKEEGIKILAREGFDPKFGARPLRRLLQDKIENIIANNILSGELKRRDTVVINEQAEIDIVKGKAL